LFSGGIERQRPAQLFAQHQAVQVKGSAQQVGVDAGGVGHSPVKRAASGRATFMLSQG
jgi:hypothetical protein